MTWSKKFLAATFASAAILFANAAKAMQIQQFDKMAAKDQGEFISQLVTGAQKVLKDHGRTDLADQVHKLFTDKSRGDQISLGMAEFEINLARAREADVRNRAKDPNAAGIEVEDAMAVTLKKNGVPVPPEFFTVASNFKPKYPSLTKDKEQWKN